MATSIGRYEIQKELGRGGMAAVYLAADTVMERPVALKLMLPQFSTDSQFSARFRREARAVAKLEHRGITPVYDYGIHQDRPYLVMRYLPGGSLRDFLDSSTPLEPQSASQLIDELAPPLDFAHDKGVIHRDLKPDNILFDEYGLPYLSDFGIVKMIEGSARTLTLTGGILGTPAYMSPEQARGNVELDGRSDVYSLGVLLFEMLVGTRPYKADTPMGLAMMHVLDPIPRLEEFSGTASPPYQALINKALAKDRDERFQTAEELAAALRTTIAASPSLAGPMAVTATALSGPPVAKGQTGSIPPGGPTAQPAAMAADGAKRKLPLWLMVVAGIALIACLGIAGVAGALVLGGDPTPTMTPTVSRTATPTQTVTPSRPSAAGEELSTQTPTRTPTRTRPPTRTPVNTPTLKPLSSTETPVSQATTPRLPSATPTATSPVSNPPTNTPRPQSPTNTPRPQSPTSTSPPSLPTSTNTPVPPPTNTPAPPTNTPVPPPTNTPVPPTNTPVPPPPTNTPPGG